MDHHFHVVLWVGASALVPDVAMDAQAQSGIEAICQVMQACGLASVHMGIAFPHFVAPDQYEDLVVSALGFSCVAN